jgi:hypothetical protein
VTRHAVAGWPGPGCRGDRPVFGNGGEAQSVAADQYFITGAVAGLSVRDGKEFRRLVVDSGDDLSDTIGVSGELAD